MTDTKSDAERSRNMAAVKPKNTRPELRLRQAVWHRGLRFFTPGGYKRLSGRPMPGSPDLIFPGARLAVFVDGCFWHGCPEHYTAPDDNAEFWRAKLANNLERDRTVDAQLRAAGWQVHRIWEHELKKKTLPQAVETVVRLVTGRAPTAAIGEELGHETGSDSDR